MIIGLITPSGTSCLSNAGAHMITAGIRWLVRQAVPDALFVNIEMLRDDPAQWDAAMTCDALVLCGNPRFSLSDNEWWEAGIWKRLLHVRRAGIRVIDAWAGACVGLDSGAESLDAQADELLALPRNREACEHARQITGCIARDALAQRMYERAGVPSALLPCSSWWAGHELGATHLAHYVLRPLNAIVLLGMAGHDWLPNAVRALVGRMQPGDAQLAAHVWTVATTWSDYVWAREHGLDVRLVTDPRSLLRLYGACNTVASFRIHASIPAASMGASVATLAVDSRARICEPFGLPVTPFTELMDAPERVRFGYPQLPSPQPAIQHLRALLTC